MGCDIHAYYEIKDGNAWKLHDFRKTYETGEKYSDGEPKVNYKGLFSDPLYIDRNYNLFAVLANVRNGQGFAGCYTGEPFTPISEPRGLPEDATHEVKNEAEEWGMDGHSHSWLSLAEVMDFDYTRVRGCSGESYRDAIGHKWFFLMQRLADKFGKDNVRIVFWFDN